MNAPGWSRRRGLSDVDVPHAGDVVLATVHRYAWAYDEREVNVLSAVLTEDATFESVVSDGDPATPLVGRAEIVRWLTDVMAGQEDQRRHCVLNPVVLRNDGATAEVCSYLLLTSARDGALRPVTSGTYRMTLERTADAVWRINRLVAAFDCPF